MAQQPTTTPAPVLPAENVREYLQERRRALLTEIAAIEKCLGIPRTVPSREERRAAERWGKRGCVADEG